ncbi:hypothetical protein ACJIZ3_009060 [Penstemon smallii]|uniref:NAC domain-containing protein n=1 Tax=Penstemon smallii TaxID=265156 RepID=A0ABD3TBG1_9LAMI
MTLIMNTLSPSPSPTPLPLPLPLPFQSFSLAMEYVEVFPPGYHFNPTDDELIVHYLKKKTMNEPIPYSKISEVNIYQYNPQQLSEKFPPLEENILYFFTPRDRKFQRSNRVNRVAGNGNWKATAKDKSVCYNGEVVGFKKVLVFYEGNSKTNWIMYEYALKEHNPKRNSTNNMRMDDWFLCRIHNRDDKSLKSQNRQVVASVPNENYIQSSPQSIDIGGLSSNGLINDCEDYRVLPPCNNVLNEDLQHRLDHLQANVQFNDNFLLSGFHDVEENPFTNNYLNEELVQEADDHQVKRLKTTNCDLSNVDGFDDFCKNLRHCCPMRKS